ncbi:ligand-binding sensor domain-containing protein [Pedobacter lusitanus]|nr:hypothetical protein [Pedobacter lusitanus]
MKIRHLLNSLLFLSLILTGMLLKAAQIKSIGVPYVQNFPKSVYLSGNQNWAIAKDAQGIMYFGNTQGLLTYDGKYWQQYQLPNRQIVRSVATDSKGKVYTGGFGEFGYWSTQNKKLTYTSLVKLIPKIPQLSDEIWKIHIDGKRIIFQSFTTIYIYENNKISEIKGPGSFLFLHHVGSRYLIEVLDKGIFELKGHKLTPLPHTDQIIPRNIMTILPYKNGSMLIGTSKDGLFIYNGSTFTPFQTPANDFLITFQLNNGSR